MIDVLASCSVQSDTVCLSLAAIAMRSRVGDTPAVMRSTCVLLLFAVHTSARAGGSESSSGSDSTGGSGSTGGADTTGAGSTGDATGDATSDDAPSDDAPCSQCSPGVADGTVTFFGIANGAVIEDAVTFEVGATPSCACDDCGCYDDDASQIRLEIDGMAIDQSCAGTSCEFTISVPSGTHTLAAIATYDFGEVSSAIEVEGPAAADSTGGSTGPAADDGGGSGCGCRTGPRGTGPAWMALVSFAACTRRRSRRA